MEVKLEKKPGFTVVGMKHRGKPHNKEIPQLWSQFLLRAAEIKNRTDEAIYFGAEDNYDETTREFDYMACVEVNEADSLPSGMEQWQIPANTYAIFATTLPHINDTYASIESRLADSGLERKHAPEFELYDETFAADDPESLFYIYVPVKEN